MRASISSIVSVSISRRAPEIFSASALKRGLRIVQRAATNNGRANRFPGHRRASLRISIESYLKCFTYLPHHHAPAARRCATRARSLLILVMSDHKREIEDLRAELKCIDGPVARGAREAREDVEARRRASHRTRAAPAPRTKHKSRRSSHVRAATCRPPTCARFTSKSTRAVWRWNCR